MAKEAPSWQEVLRRRGTAALVGRDAQLELFRDNLRLPVTDPRKLLIFNVWGNAGVGKTMLLDQLRQIAEDHGFAGAYIDEGVYDPAEAMARIAHQLPGSGVRMRQFAERYETYRRHQRRLLADPGAPAGLSSMLTRLAVKAGVRAAQGVPFVGMAASVIDESLAAEQVDRIREFVAEKIRSHEDVDLVMDPVAGLTPRFIRDLDSVGGRGVILFIDTYERTAVFLDGWLREMLRGRYGQVPGSVALVIAGQLRLDRTSWELFAPLTAGVGLDVFSQDEARRLISSHGIADERAVEAIVNLSGGLPVLVDMLAREYRGDVAELPDPSETAVERFLKWVADRDLREIVLATAVARTFNRDTVSSLVPDTDGADAFPWLIAQPFVRRGAEGYRYHEIIRAQMLRLLRTQSPDGWRRHHKILAQHYRSVRQGISRKKERWQDPAWTANLLEESYHRLCMAPGKSLPHSAELAMRAAARDDTLGNQWTAMLGEAAADSGDPAISVCAHLTSRLLAPTGEEEAPVPAAEFYASGVKQSAWADMLFDGADDAFYRGQFERAIRYANQVIELSPRRAVTFILRGAARANVGRFDQAFGDFDHAIRLDPANHVAFVNRGFFNYVLGRSDEALADLDHALQLKPGSAWVLEARGQVLAGAGRFEEALADFGRAIEINPAQPTALAIRAGIFRLGGRLDEALADVDNAIDTDPSFGWALGLRGEIHRAMGDYDSALADLDRALEIEPDATWWIGLRGLVLMLAGQDDQARPALRAAATELRAPQQLPWDAAWLLLARGVCYALLGEQRQARESWDLARLTPNYPAVRLVYIGGLSEVRKTLTTTALDALLQLLTTDPE
jgi:tetratricopeptide (TPR) repeat protein